MMVMNKNILVLFSVMFVSTMVQLYGVESSPSRDVVMDKEIVEVLEQLDQEFEKSDQEIDLDEFVWDDDCLLDGICLEDLEKIEECDMSLSDKAKLILMLAKIHIMSNKQKYIIGGVIAGVLVGGFVMYRRSSKIPVGNEA